MFVLGKGEVWGWLPMGKCFVVAVVMEALGFCWWEVGKEPCWYVGGLCMELLN